MICRIPHEWPRVVVIVWSGPYRTIDRTEYMHNFFSRIIPEACRPRPLPTLQVDRPSGGHQDSAGGEVGDRDRGSGGGEVGERVCGAGV